MTICFFRQTLIVLAMCLHCWFFCGNLRFRSSILGILFFFLVQGGQQKLHRQQLITNTAATESSRLLFLMRSHVRHGLFSLYFSVCNVGAQISTTYSGVECGVSTVLGPTCIWIIVCILFRIRITCHVSSFIC